MVKVEFSFVNARNQVKNVNFYMDEKSYEMSLKLDKDERQRYLMEEYREYCKEQHYKRRVFVVKNLRVNDQSDVDIINNFVKESLLRQVISVLNETEKDLIVKHFFYGISKVKIAEEYRITEGAVRKRIKNCLHKMSEVIKVPYQDLLFDMYFMRGC